MGYGYTDALPRRKKRSVGIDGSVLNAPLLMAYKEMYGVYCSGKFAIYKKCHVTLDKLLYKRTSN